MASCFDAAIIPRGGWWLVAAGSAHTWKKVSAARVEETPQKPAIHCSRLGPAPQLDNDSATAQTQLNWTSEQGLQSRAGGICRWE
ncbi:uncharacterized protein TrAtP1_002910 [Trichoderma atroviride]|uniref:Uncharacterized protein n=1 Tax=Hypocrea atroviridis (strain ATCC 20476 / IMI 206040) TaxID=452589 RepID=G9NXH7_HYPAI|nr:uncharacterized protein TRIATDRAFT_318369 [Trichoderma atroviride IMI 206040]EHK44784.1 hypothetical protein TRIATDRAFT_318369 [Trichoderma atroviride IMI 206040]UKZ61652.1 hypothetical protein TrAtP1_002910 [Trichoderma atroviride]